MKPKHIRAFYIGRQRFHVTDRGNGTLQVSSIHPYDETDYHWAFQASNPAGTSAAKAGRSAWWPAWTALKSHRKRSRSFCCKRTTTHS